MGETLLTAQVEETWATTALAEEMPLIARVEGTLETGQPRVEEIGLDPEIYPPAVIEAAMRSEEAVADLMDRERVWTAIAAHRAWRPAEAEEGEEVSEAGEEEVVAEEVAADDGDSGDSD